MTRSGQLLLLCLGFMAGIGLASFFFIDPFLAYLFLLLSLTVLILCWSKQNFRLMALVGLFLFFGWGRFSLTGFSFNQERLIGYTGKTLSLEGQVIEEPDQRIDQVRLALGHLVMDINGQKREVKGRLLVVTNLYPKYSYGERLTVYGQLQKPAIFPDFDYSRYLARYGIYAVTYYPAIKKLEGNYGSWFYAHVLGVKEKLQLAINQSLTEPSAGLLSAMLLGERGNITKELRQEFSNVGISHIIAISGLHITIIAGLLMNLMMFFHLSRQKSFYLAIIFLTFFIILIGAPASAVRAGIMGFLVLWGQYLGRPNRSINALILTATIMLLFNPWLLSADLGFQLSFLAVLGIIYLKPFLARIYPKKRDKWQIRDSLEMTLSAQAMTLPLLVFAFGQFSLIAPLTNILVLPILPFLLMLGLAASLIGIIFLPLAQIIFWPVWLMLNYILKIAQTLEGLPFSSWQISWPSWLVGLIYLLIFFWLFRLAGRRKLN